ncbi:MAG: hypothetical protein ACT4OO_15115 [Nitrospiraceae bacterium]
MEPDVQLSDYRTRLLETLEDHSSHRHRERSDFLQVFVNHARVGTLDCRRGSPAFTYADGERVIETIEIRTEAGTLVGGLCAPEIGMRTACSSLSGHALEISVHNQQERGSARVAYQPASARWGRLQQAAENLAAGLSGLRPVGLAWPRTLAAAQICVTAVALFLITDRWMDRTAQSHLEKSSSVEAAIRDDMRSLEQKLAQFTETQTAVAQTQQQHIAKLQHTLNTVTQTQQQLAAGVMTVQREVNDKKGVGREVDHLTRLLMSKVDAERDQVHKELKTLTAANEGLTKQLSALEGSNQELKNRLKSAGLDVSKVSVPPEKDIVIAEKATPPPQVAEARRDNPAQPFTFWVSFQDGTSEESIDHLMQEIHGRKGANNAGWYDVVVSLPQPQPADGVLESLKHAKIVKAVTTHRTLPPGQ